MKNEKGKKRPSDVPERMEIILENPAQMHPRKKRVAPSSRQQINRQSVNRQSSNRKPQKKKAYKKVEKKKKKIFPIIFFLLVLILGIIVYINFTEEASTVKGYFSKINSKDYDGAYEYVKTSLSKDEFVDKIKNVYDGIEASNISVKVVGKTFNKFNKTKEDQNDESKVTYNVTITTVAGNMNYTNTSKIIKKDGKSKIDWDVTDIHPDLTEDTKIRVKTIDFKRGTIYDRSGHVIAKDANAYLVGIVPSKIDDTTNLSKVAELLGLNKKDIETKVKANYVSENTFVPLKKISREEQETKNAILKIKGMMVSDVTVRTYPYKEVTSAMTGYVQNDEGKAGLEQSLNETLAGKVGKEVYIDKDSTSVKSLAKTNQVDGKDVKLTINIDIQKQLYDQFKNDEGAAVSIDYKTGEVLALVSTPTYDANKFSLGITNEEWDKLQNDKRNPLFVKYTSTYAPGSTIKPIIGAIGVQNNLFGKNEDFGKSNLKWQKDKTWKDFFVTTLETYDGEANLENALVYSDNIYFAKAALKIGKEELVKELNKFGFESNLDFAQAVQTSTHGKLDSDKSIANTGYGQSEVLVNPILMASIYSSFANNGNMVKPYLIYEEDEKLRTKYFAENVIDEEVANTIKEDLIQVVQKGTARSAIIENKVIAGKTGTAEIKKSQDDKEGTEIGWFDSFDDNNLLIVGMCENVKKKGGSDYVVKKIANVYKGEN